MFFPGVRERGLRLRDDGPHHPVPVLHRNSRAANPGLSPRRRRRPRSRPLPPLPAFQPRGLLPFLFPVLPREGLLLSVVILLLVET